MNNKPVKLSGPIFRPPWSSNALSQLYDRLEGLGAIGEIWDTAVAPSAIAVLPSGEQLDFSEYLNRKELSAPPLVKLLSAGKPLSVQVHPDSRAAAIHGGESKIELWYVLRAEEGSFIYYGARDEVTLEELRLAIFNKSVTDLLVTMPVKAGDVVVIPPGMIHSLGEGITVLEVQNAIGTTYRLQDISSDRETHPVEALDSIRFYSREQLESLTFSAQYDSVLPGKLIASMKEFSVSVCEDETASVPDGGVYMLCVEGKGEANELCFTRGDAVFFSENCNISLAPHSKAIFVTGNLK